MGKMREGTTPYRRRSHDAETLRIVVLMPKSEADAADQWGVPAGMTSRTSAVRFLLRKGLETLQAERSGQSAK